MRIPKQKRHKGLTIIELTIVIVVLLGLVAILFFGARAFLVGSNRAQCISNLRAAHQAARSYQNLSGLQPGDNYDATNFIGQGNFLNANPTCPSNGEYEWADSVPEFGSLFMTCTLATDAERTHTPKGDVDW